MPELVKKKNLLYPLELFILVALIAVLGMILMFLKAV